MTNINVFIYMYILCIYICMYADDTWYLWLCFSVHIFVKEAFLKWRSERNRSGTVDEFFKNVSFMKLNLVYQIIKSNTKVKKKNNHDHLREKLNWKLKMYQVSNHLYHFYLVWTLIFAAPSSGELFLYTAECHPSCRAEHKYIHININKIYIKI